MEYKTGVFRSVTTCTFVDDTNVLMKPAASIVLSVLICKYFGKSEALIS